MLLISEGEGSKPNKLRPIGTMSCAYRLWAAARVGDVLSWQEHFMDISCMVSGVDMEPRAYGGRKCWKLTMPCSRVFAFSDCPWIMASFGRFTIRIVLHLSERYGMSPKKVEPVRSLYAQLSGRVRFGVSLSNEFRSIHLT